MAQCSSVLCRFVFSSGLSMLRSYSGSVVSICGYARRHGRREKMPTDLGFPDVVDEEQEISYLDPDCGNTESYDDFFNSNDRPPSKSDLERFAKKERENLKFKILERKYFKKPQEVNLLTWETKEQIRFLNAEYPKEWTPRLLAQSFPVSEEGVLKLLKSKYSKKSEEEILKHDLKVKQRWKELKAELSLEGGPVDPQYKQFIESGKLTLMNNASGLIGAPKTHLQLFPGSKQDSQKKVGVFESIIKNYKESKQIAENVDTKVDEQKDLTKLYLDSSDVKSDFNEFIENASNNQATVNSRLISFSYNSDKHLHQKPEESPFHQGNVPAETAKSNIEKVPRSLRRKVKDGEISFDDLTYLEVYQLVGTEKIKSDKNSNSARNATNNHQVPEQQSHNLLNDLVPKYQTSNYRDFENTPKTYPEHSDFSVQGRIIIPEHSKRRKGILYKKNDAYYDETGKSLYKVPMSE